MLRRSAARFSTISSGPIIVRSYSKTSVVTLNRESALNALNLEMVRSLHGFYSPLMSLEPNSHLVVMRGAGTKAFCAGGDVVSIVKDDPKGNRQQFFYEEYQVNNMIATMRQPQVSLWDGIVMGGGFGVSIHGRHRVATSKTLFAMPETGIGLFPDVGGTYVLPRLRTKGLGMFLGLTGSRLKGADVFHAGLATAFVGPDASAVGDLLHTLVSLDKVDVKELDHLLSVATDKSGVKSMPFSLAPHLDVIARTFGSDEATNAAWVMKALEAESATNEFAKTTLAGLKKCCPIALEVTFALLRNGAKLPTVTSAFEVEYRAGQRFMEGKDFDAGVTALLIEKSGKPPVWSHEDVSKVSAEEIRSYFTLPEGRVEWHPTRPYGAAASGKL